MSHTKLKMLQSSISLHVAQEKFRPKIIKKQHTNLFSTAKLYQLSIYNCTKTYNRRKIKNQYFGSFLYICMIYYFAIEL